MFLALFRMKNHQDIIESQPVLIVFCPAEPFTDVQVELGIENRVFGTKYFESSGDCPYLNHEAPGIFYWTSNGFQNAAAPLILPGVCSELFICSHFKWQLRRSWCCDNKLPVHFNMHVCRKVVWQIMVEPISSASVCF